MIWFGAGLIYLGLFFFFAGSLGLLRLPDLHSRLHALTKADNLGLGLVCIGLSVVLQSWLIALKLLLIWLLVLAASAAATLLLAEFAKAQQEQQEQRHDG